MDTQTCNPLKDNWIYKGLILLLLLGILSFSILFYYKILNKIKNKKNN